MKIAKLKNTFVTNRDKKGLNRGKLEKDSVYVASSETNAKANFLGQF